MSDWVSRGTVVLDGTHYWIKDLEDSDTFAPGTRFVSLSLVEVNPENDTEILDRLIDEFCVCHRLVEACGLPPVDGHDAHCPVVETT